ncbi:MAG TPA: hypothetical protein VES42_27915, partial [Pilimelia sp.]|nr:hypothetical protein [Pilimelia sp.]
VLPPGEVEAVVAGARARLAAGGWRLGELLTGPHESVFWATRGDDVLRLRGLLGPVGDAPAVEVAVHRRAPGAVTAGALGGLLAGAVAGWLLAVWALRAFDRHSPRGRSAMVLLGLPSLVAGAVPALAAGGGAVLLAGHGGWSPHDSLIPFIALADALWIVAAVGVGLLATGAVAAQAPSRAAPVRAPAVPGGQVPPAGPSPVTVVTLSALVGIAYLAALVLGFAV